MKRILFLALALAAVIVSGAGCEALRRMIG
jgi:hypothetical protein